ncbi:C5a anaphylatoxin chemotactic receptor 1-like [Engystomops pustulosus]|uniref:C5a anaphylatoxin chemotactic receptor 1-like n=1 Tax=Engystomops pustulosus TaxID=76066 RepID=UPI003AFA9F47
MAGQEDGNSSIMDPTDYNWTTVDIMNDCFQSLVAANETNQTDFERSNELGVLQKVSIALCSIIFVFGIIGNGLVIWIVGFRMKTISAVWFLHLAIADLLCCVTLPAYITGLYSGDVGSSVSSLVFYLLDVILLNLNMSASVLLLTAMSVDRWVSVMWPIWAKVHRTQKQVRIIAGIIWFLSLVWAGIMYLFLVNYISYRINGCETAWILRLIRLIVMFVIPFLIIVTSYVTIFLKLRKSNRPQRSQRPYRIITAVILCFFICWAPYNIWPLTPLYYILDIQNQIIDTVVIFLACLNSCINPIIYVIMGQNLRPGFLRSIPFRVQSALTEHLDDPCGEQKDPLPAPASDV